MTTTTPTKLIASLTARPSLVVVPVEHHLPTTGGNVRVMEKEGPQIYGAGGVWLTLTPPLEVGRRYYLPEEWQVPEWFDNLSANDIPEIDSDDPNGPTKQRLWYPADSRMPGGSYARHDGGFAGITRIAFHMPAWAARHFYTVRAVECRQVRTITEAEAMKSKYINERQRESTWYDGKGAELFRGGFERDHGPAAWNSNAWSWFAALEWEK